MFRKKNSNDKKGKAVMDLSWSLSQINFDLEKYKKLKEEGKTAKEAYLIAESDGLNILDCMKMLWKIYHIPFFEIKELIMKIKYDCNSLSEYQEKHILPMLEDYFNSEDINENTPKND